MHMACSDVCKNSPLTISHIRWSVHDSDISWLDSIDLVGSGTAIPDLFTGVDKHRECMYPWIQKVRIPLWLTIPGPCWRPLPPQWYIAGTAYPVGVTVVILCIKSAGGFYLTWSVGKWCWPTWPPTPVPRLTPPCLTQPTSQVSVFWDDTEFQVGKLLYFLPGNGCLCYQYGLSWFLKVDSGGYLGSEAFPEIFNSVEIPSIGSIFSVPGLEKF